MTQVDHGLTNVSRFDSAEPVIRSVGLTQLNRSLALTTLIKNLGHHVHLHENRHFHEGHTIPSRFFSWEFFSHLHENAALSQNLRLSASAHVGSSRNVLCTGMHDNDDVCGNVE
jgi:hypothetical protein